MTPNNLQYIISLSIISRFLVILIQFVSSIIIRDHDADAYRNKYHIALTNSSSQIPIPDSYRNAFGLVQGLSKWDSQYFLEISKDGYVSERHLAFLPLFPICVSLVRQLLFEHTNINLAYIIPIGDSVNYDTTNEVSSTDLELYIQSTCVGIALNNFIIFPLSCISLFMLTKLVKGKDDKYARAVVKLFCFNPASVFFSANYSESLFSALTFTAMLLIEYKAQNYATTHLDVQDEASINKYSPLAQLNRMLYICLPSLAFLALSSATRSNGVVAIGFIGFQFLLKYAPLLKSKSRENWTLMFYVPAILEILQDLLVLVISAVVAASGYITFQIYSFVKFCTLTDVKRNRKLRLRPDWCDNPIPHPYSQVQAKFWNVGFLNYYEVKQLPNFLLAIPITYLVMMGSRIESRKIKSTQTVKQLPYYIEGIVLAISCGLSINVQVTTRLLAASCPMIYWICADTCEQSRYKGRAIYLYFGLYFIIGTILHSTFYPWT